MRLQVLVLGLAVMSIVPAAEAAPRKRRPVVEDRHPGVVTQRLVLALAAGTWALADYVDPAIGLVYLDREESMEEGPRRSRRLQALLCGAPLTRQLPRIRALLHDKLLADTATGGLACHNRPGPPRCSMGGTTEYDTRVDLVFAVDGARGVRLRAVVLRPDGVHAPDEHLAKEQAAIDRQVAKLAAPGCAAPAPTAPPAVAP